MKKTVLVASLIFAVLASTNAYAGDTATAVVRAGSDLIYRGHDITGSQGTVGLGLQFNDVVYDGLFVAADLDTVEVTPANENTTVRSDVRAGYKGSLGDVGYSVELARVINPVTYAADYSEVRVKVDYSVVYAELAQGISNDVNTDTYFSVGVEGRPLANQSLLVGASASVVNYDADFVGESNVEFNNAQVYATYDLWRDLDVSAGFSYGGSTSTYDLGNHAWVAASYTF